MKCQKALFGKEKMLLYQLSSLLKLAIVTFQVNCTRQNLTESVHSPDYHGHHCHFCRYRAQNSSQTASGLSQGHLANQTQTFKPREILRPWPPFFCLCSFQI